MWALLPLKEFTNAKQRLSGVLDAQQRTLLLEAMVSDVLQALDGHPDLDGTVVVSSDPIARRLALSFGADFVDENEFGVRGLNPAVQAAVMQQARYGEDEVLVIHGDVPLITPAEIGLLVRRHRLAVAPALTLATDRRSDGSNVLLCSASAAIAFAYGKDSCARHCEEARRNGMSCEVLTLPGASCDVDEPEDLLALLEHRNLPVARHTREYLYSSGIAAMLLAQENA
jgi:2-phospho-L-lactate guanylyltransferase